MNNKKNILICPLNWGLGHATRCVPIINELLRLNFNVIIGADKNPLAFLQQEFPQLKTIIISGYEVTYDESGSFFKLFTESVRFNNFIKKEHALIDEILAEHKIDILISDNRYGLWSKKVKSIIITHQLFPKVPIGSQLVYHKIERLIKKFDECWVPDVAQENNLSGNLSHLKPFSHSPQFIGPLSRFSNQANVNSIVFEEGKNVSRSASFQYDIIAILSGPEPQRTIFEKLIIEQIQKNNLKAVIVRGLPNCSLSGDEGCNDDIIKFNHLPTKELHQYIEQSKVVVCRSGYSSIMDLATLNKKAILIPTPGQTEQEYLAKYHFDNKHFYTQKQSEFNLKKALIKVANYQPKIEIETNFTLDFFLKKLQLR